MFDLQGLGMGTTEELTEQLTSEGFNQVKVLYCMLRRRRNERKQRPGMRSPRASRKPISAVSATAGVPGSHVAAAVVAASLGASGATTPPRTPERAASSRLSSRAIASEGERGESVRPRSPSSRGKSGAGAAEGSVAGEQSASVPFEKISSAMAIITGDGDSDQVRTAASPTNADGAKAKRVRGRKPLLAVSVGITPGERAIRADATRSPPGAEGSPKYSRVRAVQDEDRAADNPITPSKKKSWFSALFRRGSSSQVQSQWRQARWRKTDRNINHYFLFCPPRTAREQSG